MKYYAVIVDERGYEGVPYLHQTLFSSFDEAMNFCYARARYSYHLEAFDPNDIKEYHDGLTLFSKREIEATYRIVEMHTR